jgi:hypothetical protein
VVDLALVHEPVHGHFARRKCLGWRARSRSSAPSRGGASRLVDRRDAASTAVNSSSTAS